MAGRENGYIDVNVTAGPGGLCAVPVVVKAEIFDARLFSHAFDRARNHIFVDRTPIGSRED